MKITGKKHNGRWSANDFFRDLTARNIMCRRNGFAFRTVSGLAGFEEALAAALDDVAFVAVSDTADGYTQINPTPSTRRVKTVFMAMRHDPDDQQARNRAFDLMHEIFNQFMSVLIQERTRLEQNRIYLDERITFQEIDRYFFTGAACAHFSLAFDVFNDLRYDPRQWTHEE
ncbi:MAG: hypothetical protein HDS67_02250 [Bacteroidales bacterium]|nr:hypothetical protein [Bacteroidales bacterium]